MKYFNKTTATIWIVFLIVVPSNLLAGETTQISQQFNRAKLTSLYRSIDTSFYSGSGALPLTFSSKVSSGFAKGELFALANFSFADITRLLNSMSRLCEAMLLHIDVKSCVKKRNPNGSNQLHVYVGNEDYRSPADSFHIIYQVETRNQGKNYSHIQMSATSGPFDTSDYSIDVEVLAITSNTSFIHLSNSAQYGFFANIVLNTYLATVGSHKVGFTEIGKDPGGNPNYIKGIEGVIERNIMRYFLALQSYLDNINLPKTLQFEARINRWYDLSRNYSRQLYELGKEDYLGHKRKEHENQLALQMAFNRSVYELPVNDDTDEDNSD
jgi:hypothetical protein